MHVLAIRRPGQRGTQKLVSRYGDRLVCVRYRYDAGAGMRYKTVELIIEQAQWTPATPAPSRPGTEAARQLHRLPARVYGVGAGRGRGRGRGLLPRK